MAGSCACVSHAKPSAFLKDQLLIRSVLLLIDQKRWAWMTTLQSNHGHAREEIFFFFDWSSSMIQSSMKPQNYKPQKQTNRNSWRRLFIPPLHVCTFTLTAPSRSHIFFSYAHKDKHTHTSHTHVCVLFCYPPTTHTPCLSWPSVSFPAALPVWQRSRQSISVRGSDAEPEWQSDRGETWQTNSQ